VFPLQPSKGGSVEGAPEGETGWGWESQANLLATGPPVFACSRPAYRTQARDESTLSQRGRAYTIPLPERHMTWRV
jgi:hypothetical protein